MARWKSLFCQANLCTANFTYGQEIPAQENGFSLDRLKIIDTLIAQVNSQKLKNNSPIEIFDIDLKEPEKVIYRVAQEIFQTQKAPAMDLFSICWLDYSSQNQYPEMIEQKELVFVNRQTIL